MHIFSHPEKDINVDRYVGKKDKMLPGEGRGGGLPYNVQKG